VMPAIFRTDRRSGVPGGFCTARLYTRSDPNRVWKRRFQVPVGCDARRVTGRSALLRLITYVRINPHFAGRLHTSRAVSASTRATCDMSSMRVYASWTVSDS
jgi:hypothetical protein